MEIKLSLIIEVINPVKFIGNNVTTINNLKELSDSTLSDNDICWSTDKNLDLVYKNLIGTYIVSEQIDESKLHSNCNYLIVKYPRKAFQKVLNCFFLNKQEYSISKTAVIKNPVIFKNKDLIFIGENVVIEKNVVIGDNVIIDHNSVIKEGTIIKNNVSIGSNCTIGGVGFGYEKNENNEYKLINHIGNVVLKNNVEIGNNSTIDRGVLGSTILYENVKVDNLVHIAHGVIIHKNSMIIANAMIAGSTTIGENSWVAPSSSIINKVNIGEKSVIGMGAVVIKNLDNESTVVGNPARIIK